MLAPSTNDAYAGAPWAAHLLAILGILAILPGIVHIALPDGGAGTIAGIDLGACRPAIVGCFAWAGATQIVFGATMLLVALRYRSLVPTLYVLVLVERGLHALNGWVLKSSGHHPPEHYAVLVALPILLAGLVASARPRVA
ncbi:MAG: hypothetical protein KIT14_04230 [bacterium]|nr:hypothetical protein [bacterium]